MLCQFQVYSKVNRLYIYISTLFQILVPFRPLQSTEQSSLCSIVGPYQLSILYVAVCICQAQSPNFPMRPVTLGKQKLFSTSVIVFLICRQIHLHLFKILHISSCLYICCCKWHYFILYGRVIFHCIQVPHLLYPFLC